MPENVVTLPPGYATVTALAVFDELHANQKIRAAAGGYTVDGLVSIAPGTTTLTSDTPNLLDEIGAGNVLILGDQVSYVKKVTGASTAELRFPHADGMTDEPFHKAGRGYRMDRDETYRATLPYWMAWPELPDSQTAVGRRSSDPSVRVAWVGEALPGRPLVGLEGSQLDILHLIYAAITASGPILTLCVPRFSFEALTEGGVETRADLATVEVAGQDDYVSAPAVVFQWRGLDPAQIADNVTARWS